MPEHGKISTYTNHKCRCEDCRGAWRQWNRAYNQARPEVARSSTRRRYAKRRLFALDYLGGKCEVCGSTENLEFHHVDPDDKDDSISSMLGCSEDRLVAELEKCQLLCRDCHWDKTRANGRVGRAAGGKGRPKGPPVHGTMWCYRGGCRCDSCKRAASEENRRAYMARVARRAAS